MDKSGDGLVTEEELKEWIQFTQKRYIWDDAEKQMKQNDMDKDGKIAWDEYKNSTYGFIEEDGEFIDDLEGHNQILRNVEKLMFKTGIHFLQNFRLLNSGDLHD